MNPNQALVLTGGSIKGAFQVGALSTIFKMDSTFQPTDIQGVSVGGLNGSFIVDRIGQGLSWSAASDALNKFWTDKITSFNDLGQVVDYGGLLGKIPGIGDLAKCVDMGIRFKGIINTDKLFKIVDDEIHPDNMRKAASVNLKIGFVDFYGNNYVEKDAQDPNIMDYIKASTLEPLIKPFYEITTKIEEIDKAPQKYYLCDGGIKSIAPLSSVIKNPAINQIIIIVCDPLDLPPGDPQYEHDLMKLAGRISAIFVNGVLKRDLNDLINRNTWLEASKSNPDVYKFISQKWRTIQYKIIYPKKDLNIDIQKFNQKDIQNMIRDGITEATAAMNGKWYSSDIPVDLQMVLKG